MTQADGQDMFSVAVPDEELEAPSFETIPTGAYRSTLQAGTRVEEKNGWKRFHVPFRGFAPLRSNGKAYEGRVLEARFPIEGTSAEAVRIGRNAVIGAAAALGLTEPVQLPTGKQGQKLTASSNEELAQHFNAMAGTEVEVYVKAKARERNGKPVKKEDGSLVMDNEISNVRALRGEG